MKAAIWGAGNIANTHAEALKAAGISLVAVVDKSEEKVKDFAKRWNVLQYGTDSSILFADDIDVVHVCTPPNLHYEMVLSLLQSKKNVLCEKPLCFDNREAETLARVAKENGCICAINLNVRFHMACQKARAIVQDPKFGRVRMIHGNYLQEFNAFPAPLDWRYNTVLAGKMRAVTEIGTHWMDISQYISNKKIKAVSALFGKFDPKRKLKDGIMYSLDHTEIEDEIDVISEDAASINIKYEDGAIGCVMLSEASQGRINRITLEVTGENQNLWWNSEDNNMLNTALKESGVNTEVFGFGNGFADTFRTLVNHFYDAVSAGKESEEPVYPTFSDGALIVKICNAILESAENDSKWVEVNQ